MICSTTSLINIWIFLGVFPLKTPFVRIPLILELCNSLCVVRLTLLAVMFMLSMQCTWMFCLQFLTMYATKPPGL